MMDITVKTLDGQNRTYCIPENITVKQFKEKIANSININADIQRLIFQGRVMQDDKLLKEYDVHGKVIHVVQRLPPTARPPGSSSTSTTSTPPGGSATQRDLNRILIGSFNVPSGVLDPNNVQSDGHSLDVHIHLGQIPGAQQSESQLRIDHARRMLGLARENLDRLDGAGNESTTSTTSNESQQPSASSPMDTTEGEATPRTQQEPVAQTTNTSTPAPSAQPPSSTQEEAPSQSNATPESSQTDNQPNQPNQPRGPIRPNISVVATMLEEVHEVNRRLQPYLERYQEIVRADAQLSPDETVNQQLVCNLIGEILHAISHCYHSLSDLMVDLSEPPPRQLYAAFVPVAVPTAVIQQTMPVHAQINLGIPRQAPQRSTGTQSTVPTSSQSTTTSQASNNAASQTPPVQTAGTTAGATTTTGAPGTQTTPSSTAATGSAPTVTRASTDPYVFVEVGPDHAVTVNSITAHVISSEGETPNTSASNTGSTMTGPQDRAHNNMAVDLIQNIVTSVMQAHGDPRGSMWHLGGSRNRSRSNSRTSATVNPGAAGTNPVTNSSGTQTTATSATNNSGTQTQTSATNSSGTQTGARPQAATLVLPRLPGAGLPRMPGNSNAMDPFLSCNSRHFLRYQARNMQNQAGNGHNVEQEGGIGGTDAISELMVNLLNEVNPHLQGHVGRPPTQPANSSAATTSSSSTTTGANSQATTSTATSTTSTSAAGSIPMFNPFAGLMQGMAGMMPGGAGPVPQFARMPMPMAMPNFASMFGQMAQGMQGMRPTTTMSSGTRTTSGTNPQEPAFVQQLRSFLQTNENPTPPTSTGSTSTTQSSTTPPGDRPNPVMTDEAFTQLVRGISNMVTQTAMGNPPTESISDFLASLGDNYSLTSSGEGFFNDIFNCVSAHLTFPDLIQVFYGNRQPLNRVRVPLQEFIRQRVLQGEEPTPQNLEVAVDRLISDMQEEIEACSRFSEVKADIDLTATLNGFFRRQMLVTCRMIMNSDETNTNFGAHFYERVRRTFAELVVLTRSCLVGGQPDLERLLQNRLTYITRGVNPMIQQWMVGVTTQQLNQFLPTITILEDDVAHFVVKKSDKKTEVKKESDKSENNSASTSALSMETSPPTTSPGAAQESPQPMELNNGSPDASVTSTSVVPKPKLNGSVKPKVKATESPGAAASGEAWEAEVPQDWVPIISLDVEKQKHQRPQPPLSDTYLQGMPAKRRKIMPQEGSMSMSNPSQTIPESLRRAVAAAGVEPISNMENLTNEASDNKDLEQAFDEQVASSIHDRLGNDSDYRAERFPNTEQYYRKNKK